VGLSAAMEAFVSHSWPGNIRELQNLIERAVIRSAGDELHVPLEDLYDGDVVNSAIFSPLRPKSIAAVQPALPPATTTSGSKSPVIVRFE
jgi:DNA-binding NtrC family response regulator